MSIQLPTIVENYIEAKNNHDTAAMLACFAENAVVYDDGEDLQLGGTAAIKRWIEETTAKYQLSLRVISADAQDEETVVTIEVSGDFPGSPVLFYYHFTLENEKIVKLRVHT